MQRLWSPSDTISLREIGAPPLSRLSRLITTTSFAGLALLAGCSATSSGSRHGQSSEVRIGVGRGVTTVEPAHYPTYRGGETLPEGKNTRIAVGGLAGFVICRVGGANYIVSIGCAAIGGLVGGSTYNPAHDIRTDGEFLINQVAVLRVGEFRSRNSLVRPDLTNHISVLQEWTVRGRYYKKYKMIQIDVGGNTREYFGVISRESIGGVFRLENMIDIPR